ncbi:MAG TPA: biotin--[acetyl-CoA-carboxylase] ligase [Burkholderiales bacterium]|nr:biotin--[acetyl-CoA-carboxylase] ligase [Burkholderiales bacterium]
MRKLVADLEALGVRVLAEDSGLRLERPVDLYDAKFISEQVDRVFPDLRIECLDECRSTSTVLAERARAGAAHGTVLACEHQSDGRGRRGNSWFSTVGGGITFSILWRFSRGAGALTGLSLAVAVGAAKALESLGAREVGVKWPNDLLCGAGKLGGILVETAGEAAGPVAAVVGVGVNYRLDGAARERIARPVTDIAMCCDEMPSRSAALARLVSHVASSLEGFSREGFAAFRLAWLERHAWQGRRVVLSQADRSVAEGRVVGIADDGSLELASERGIQRFRSGELSLRLG